MLPRSDEAYEIVTVQSGARSLRALSCGETFHPVIGPMAEAVALHVHGQRLVERARAGGPRPFIIWDVGLGAAANAIAALEALRHADVRAEIHSFDHTLGALAFAVENADALGYLRPHAPAAESLLADGEWHEAGIHWRVHHGDFRETLHGGQPAPDAILYDPYSPAANPELWSVDVFAALHARLDPGRPCLWTNYTRSTAVRVTLLLAGFFVGRGGATGEKDETTTASNCLTLLDRPLDRAWLGRVRRSTRSAPLHAASTPANGMPIAEADWLTLTKHRQFADHAA